MSAAFKPFFSQLSFLQRQPLSVSVWSAFESSEWGLPSQVAANAKRADAEAAIFSSTDSAQNLRPPVESLE